MSVSAMAQALAYAKKHVGSEPDRLLLDMVMAANDMGLVADEYTSFPDAFRVYWWLKCGNVKMVVWGMTDTAEHGIGLASEFLVCNQGARAEVDRRPDEINRRRTASLRAEISNNRRWYLDRLAGEDGVLSCANCGSTNNPHIDHIVPLSRGGGNELDNLQILCMSCNFSKGTKTMAEWVGVRA